MHTDDDIFESLNIDENSVNNNNTGNNAGVVDDFLSEGKDEWKNAGKTSSSDDIFEDLDMEEKIYQTALIKEEKGRKETRFDKGGGRRPTEKQEKQRTPKVLNTVDSSVDRKKYTKEKETKKKSKIKKVIICTIIELITLAAIFAYGYFLRSWNLIARPEVRIEAIENNNISLEKKKEMEGYWNIAVFGVDARSSNVVERGLNSDVIMIASINKDTGDIRLVSVFRDTYLNISEKNSYNKINQAYAIGGPEQALAALNKNLDLNIQHYVAFNWKAVAEGINILGGVDNIPISKAELYYINAYITETVNVTKIGSYQLTSTGPQHLDGVQAVAYGRLRYMDNDFARTERQRNIIKAAFSKAKQANFSVLNNIMVVCFPQVATNIDFNEVIEMAQNITQYNIADTGGFPWSRGDANIGKKGDCVVPTTLESNVIKLHEFLFGDTNYVPSDAVLSISEKIKSDSKLYKEGKFVESVSTDGGVIQKPKVAAVSTESSADTSDSSSKTEKVTLGVDEDGNYIYPTDEDGNIVVPTDEAGDVVYPTDEDGNIIKETRPTELSEEDENEPGGHSSISPGNDVEEEIDYSGGPGSVGMTTPGSSSGNTNPTKETKKDNTSNAPLSPAGADSEGPASNSPGSSGSGSVTASANPITNSGTSLDRPVVSEGGPGSLSTGSSSSSSEGGPGSVSSSSSGSSNSAANAPAGAAPASSGTSSASPAGADTSSSTVSSSPGSGSSSSSPSGNIDSQVVTDGPG